MRPFLPQIAPFVVAQTCIHSSTMDEFVSFLGTTTLEFIETNVDDILPPLYGDCNKPALDLIARKLGKAPALTLTRHGQHVLPYVCLLMPPASSKAIAFIDSVIKAIRKDANVRQLAISDKTKTLASIVIAMGLEDERAVDKVSSENSVKNKEMLNFRVGYSSGLEIRSDPGSPSAHRCQRGRRQRVAKRSTGYPRQSQYRAVQEIYHPVPSRTDRAVLCSFHLYSRVVYLSNRRYCMRNVSIDARPRLLNP